MLKDFLTENNVDNTTAMENVSSMAIMLGEDPTVACENDTNATGVMSRFKSRVSAILTRIKEYMQKVITWLKGKFLDLFKIDTFEVDQKLWNDAQAVLKLCDKVEGGPVSKFVSKIKAAKAAKSEDSAAYHQMKTDMVTAANEVYSSEAYKSLQDSSYGGENAKLVSVRASSLENQKTKFATAMNELQELAKAIQADISEAHAGTPDAKYLELQVAGVDACIKLLNIRMAVINKIITASAKTVRKAEKKED